MSTEWDEVFGRQLGKTSRQILDAPQSAIYLAVHQKHTSYVQDLARYLGREDLRVESVHRLIDDPGWACGLRRPFVFDHAAEWHLTWREAETLDGIRRELSRRGRTQ